MGCNHTVVDADVAFNCDGLCPLCLLEQVAGLEEELQQFREVAGLSPLEYPSGRRLPDAELKQDPAFLALTMGNYEQTIAELREEW